MTRDFFTPSQDDGWRRLNNSQLPSANRRLRAISHVELGEDVGHVILHRSLGEVEFVRDFFVRGAVAEEGEDLALAAGERDDERFRSRAACFHQAREGGNDAAGDGGLQERLAARGRVNRGDEGFKCDVFQEIAVRAGAQCTEKIRVVVERGEDENRRRRKALANARRRLNAVEPRHAQVHQHDRRMQRLDERDRFLAVRRFADDLEIVARGEERAQPFAKEHLIVGDDDADHAGSSTSSVKPWSGDVVVRIEPPSCSARSRMPLSPKPPALMPFAPRPSSRIDRRILLSSNVNATPTCCASAWRRTFVNASSVVRCSASAVAAPTGRGVPLLSNVAVKVSSRTLLTSDRSSSAMLSKTTSSRSAFTDWRTAVSPSFASACARLTARRPRSVSLAVTGRPASSCT